MCNSIQWKIRVLGLLMGSVLVKLVLKCVPFNKISKHLGKPMCQDLGRLTQEQKEALAILKLQLEEALQLMWWSRNCLNQAILGKIILRRKQIPSTLHLGVASSLNPKQMIAAHAWLTVGPDIVCGDNGKTYSFLVCYN